MDSDNAVEDAEELLPQAPQNQQQQYDTNEQRKKKRLEILLKCGLVLAGALIGGLVVGLPLHFTVRTDKNCSSDVVPDYPVARPCPNLTPPLHSVFTCSSGEEVGSVCTLVCLDDHVMQGNGTTMCLNNSTWSFYNATCVCPKCQFGDECEKSTDWGKVKDTITGDGTYKYAGFELICKNGLASFKFSCTCVDGTTGNKAKCKRFESRSGACKHAGSQLIKDQVSKGLFPEPCDPADLDDVCDEPHGTSLLDHFTKSKAVVSYENISLPV